MKPKDYMAAFFFGLAVGGFQGGNDGDWTMFALRLLIGCVFFLWPNRKQDPSQGEKGHDI